MANYDDAAQNFFNNLGKTPAPQVGGGSSDVVGSFFNNLPAPRAQAPQAPQPAAQPQQNVFDKAVNFIKSIPQVFQQPAAQPEVQQKPPAMDAQAKATQARILQEVGGKTTVAIKDMPGIIKNIPKEISQTKVKEPLIGAAKALPGQFETGGGIIISSVLDMNKFMSKYTVDPLRKIGIMPTYEIDTQIRKGVEDFALQLREKGVKDVKQAREEYAKVYKPSPGIAGSLESLLYNVPQVGANIGLSMATLAVTKNPALAAAVGIPTSYALNSAEIYDEARNFGLSDSQSLPMAQIGGIGMSILDNIPVVNLINKSMGRVVLKEAQQEIIKKSLLTNFKKSLVSVAAQSGSEGVTEGMQTILQNAIAMTYNENKQLLEGVPESIFVGAILGAGSDVTMAGVDTLMGAVQNNKVEKILQKALETPKEKRTEEQQQLIDAVTTQEMTPDNAIQFVADNDLGKTTEGMAIMREAIKAKDADMNLKIALSQDEKSAEITQVKPGEGIPSPTRVKQTEVTTQPQAQQDQAAGESGGVVAGKAKTDNRAKNFTLDNAFTMNWSTTKQYLTKAGYSPEEIKIIMQKSPKIDMFGDIGFKAEDIKSTLNQFSGEIPKSTPQQVGGEARKIKQNQPNASFSESTRPVMSASIKEPSSTLAGRVELSDKSMDISVLSPEKSTTQTLSSNKTNFLARFDMSDPSDSNLADYRATVKEQEPLFVDTLTDIANNMGGDYLYRVKTDESVKIKLARRNKTKKNSYPLGKIGDTLGGTIIVDPSKINETIKYIQDKYKITKIENFNEKPTFFGYKAVHLDYELPNGMTTEIQINTRKGIAQKEYVHATIYEKWRKYIEKSGGSATYDEVIANIEEEYREDFKKDVDTANRVFEGIQALPDDFVKKYNGVYDSIKNLKAGENPRSTQEIPQAQETQQAQEKPLTKAERDAIPYYGKKEKKIVGRVQNVDQGIGEAIRGASTQEGMIQALDKYVEQYKVEADQRNMADLRAGLVKEISNLIGSSGKSYKADYALRVAMRDNPDVGELIKQLEYHISNIDDTIKSFPERTLTQGEQISGTQKGAGMGPQLPVAGTVGGKAESRLQERLQEQLLSMDQGKYEFDEKSGKYNKVNLEADAKKAVDLMESDPEKALRVAKGLEVAPEGIMQNSISMAVALKARDEGNYELWKNLVTTTSLRSTRYGQEIVSLRGHFNADSPESFIKKALDARMDKLGSGIVSDVQVLLDKIQKKSSSRKSKAIDKIDKQTEVLSTRLRAEQNKIQLAQDLINSLICK